MLREKKKAHLATLEYESEREEREREKVFQDGSGLTDGGSIIDDQLIMLLNSFLSKWTRLKVGENYNRILQPYIISGGARTDC
jgi:hypothetical protein